MTRDRKANKLTARLLNMTAWDGSLLPVSLLLLCLGLFFLGFENIVSLIIWFLCFSSLHYVLNRLLKCPETLTPLVCLASIVSILYLSGVLGSLHYGFFFIIAVVLSGFAVAFWKKESRFVFSQPSAFTVYYLLSLTFFVQNSLLCKGFTFTDDMHHWGVVINGMCHYHRLTGFPRLEFFDHYTLGPAVWAYFINRLSLQTFRFHLASWANALILTACFIPTLGFFKDKIDKNTIRILVWLLLSFILFCFDDLTVTFFGVACVLQAFFSLKDDWQASSLESEKIRRVKSTLIFASFFLLYSALMIAPNLVGSTYRSIKPEIALATISGAVLIAYLANPSVKTLLWVTPILPLGYLLKTPGIFFVIAVSVAIWTHHFVSYSGKYFLLLKKRRLKVVTGALLSILLLFVALALPPKIWNSYCNIRKVSNGIQTKLDAKFIKNCFFNKSRPVFVLNREKFLDRFYNESLFKLDLKEQGYLAPFVWLEKKIDETLATTLVNGKEGLANYPVVMIAITLLYIPALLAFLKRRKTRYFCIIAVIMLIMALLHLLGVFVNYSYWFSGSNLVGVIPSYQRYITPITKVLILCALAFYAIILLRAKDEKRSLVLTFSLFFVSLCLASALGLKTHVEYQPEHIAQIAMMNAVPSKIDFKEKSLLVFGIENHRGLNYLGPLLMNYHYSCPKIARYFAAANKQTLGMFRRFDYIWWHQENIFDSPLDILKLLPEEFRDLLDDPAILRRNCIFKYSGKKLVPIFCDDHELSCILSNGDFKNGLDGWEFDTPHEVKTEENLELLVISSGENSSVKQKVALKGGNYYKISLMARGQFRNNICARLGNIELKAAPSPKLVRIEKFFYSEKDQEVDFSLLGGFEKSAFADVQIIDFGRKDRNINKKLSL